MSPTTVKLIITGNVVAAAVLVVASSSILPARPGATKQLAKNLRWSVDRITSVQNSLPSAPDEPGRRGPQARRLTATAQAIRQAAGQLGYQTKTVYLIWCLYWGSIAVLMLSTMAGISYLTSLQKLWGKPVAAPAEPAEVAEPDGVTTNEAATADQAQQD